MTVHLICEGEPAGLDNRVLDNLVIQYHNLNVQMAPSGGGKGLGAVRVYLLNRAHHDVAISVQDRDYFHTRAQAHAGWGNKEGDAFTWRRHEIENYLLHPLVVLALFKDYQSAGNAWSASLPATESDVLSMLQVVAGPWLENHVGEVLRVELLRCSTALGNLVFGPASPASAPGGGGPGQTDWTRVLQIEAMRLCAACATVATVPDFQPTAIMNRYQVLLAEFHQQALLTSEDFLIEMSGKELIAALAAHLRGIGAPSGFTAQFLSNELLRVLIPIYQPGAIYNPDDFHELAGILSQY